MTVRERESSDRRTRAALAVVFSLSGAAGLIYEVVWTQQLALVFGVTTHAVATLLSTFMAGLALGSYLVGRRVDRLHNPLLAYAALELLIGLYPLALPGLFSLLRPTYVLLHRLELSDPLFAAARALLAGLLLLPPTTLLGGTLPALLCFWARSRADVGRQTGFLYAVNTAGGIAGCMVAGFVLIEHFGLQETTWIAAGMNLAAGLLAAALALSTKTPQSVPAHDTEFRDVPDIPTSGRALPIVMICVAISGFTSLAYEVLWTRALLRYLFNSTYAFTTMLATWNSLTTRQPWTTIGRFSTSAFHAPSGRGSGSGRSSSPCVWTANSPCRRWPSDERIIGHAVVPWSRTS